MTTTTKRYKLSRQHRKAISDGMQGHKLSRDTKAKLSAALRRYHRKRRAEEKRKAK